MVVDSGSIRIASENLSLRPTGAFQSVEELGDLIIPGTSGNKLIYLRDVATIHRGFQDIPDHLVTFDQSQAINIGISFTQGVNVVEVGKAVNDRLAEVDFARPAGMTMKFMYNQPVEVDNSVRDFVLNLLAAVVIVIVVLLVFMGVKSGILIGLILFLTCLGTFTLMLQAEIELQRISLGALIIALGMLVDNAIVVVEGILMGRQRGLSSLKRQKPLLVRQCGLC